MRVTGGSAVVELEGQLVEIIFQNESNGYMVGILEAKEEIATIVGCLPAIKEGEQLAVKGKWAVHPVYGRQLEVGEYRPIQPSTKEGILNYLSSGVIKGVGKKMAERIVDLFGMDSLEVIQYAPERLREVEGIGRAKAETITETFRDQKELREIILFLSEYHITPNYAVKIHKKYGDKTIATIQENPYRLADEIVGIGFKRADAIARNMGVHPHSKYRIHSGIKYMLNTFQGEGHTYAPGVKLIQRAEELLRVEEGQVEGAIQELALNQEIQLERIDDEIIVYSMPYYYAESNVCKKLISLAQVELDPIEMDIDEELQKIEQAEEMTLAKQQKEAIKEAIENGISVITGGPGTGKTTTINSLIKVFEKLELKMLLAAPTGRASKRMTEATGKESKTIHRLLELGFGDDREGMLFQRNEDNPLDCHVIIIDEVSMVDIILMNSLMKSIARGTRVVLVGDVDQLPSVGAGNVLRDIIDSKVVKTIRLTEIFRQAQESMIVVNAHRINQGLYPQLNEKQKDFYFMKRNAKEDVLATVVELVRDRLPKHYQFDALRDIQVLTPMKKGETGTLNLNKELQAALNPPNVSKAEKDLKEKIFREGDKVMQIKNNYTLKWRCLDPMAEEQKGEGVFNGDIGYVQSIDTEAEELVILFDDQKQVNYSFTQLDELELAYSVTIHKSQGSEFPVVVIPITWGPPMLLTRNLLYTAVTRARSLVVLVGVESYLKKMVDNNKIIERYSGLGRRLGKYFEMQIKDETKI
ncbi:helicase, RecD/TraA family [Alkaliphilus metalliredigens QYMF]|uniref:ATP-dependent RecD2 DNA helicase n=1 Tax=Alkaliphilus metalliredigens (strain QYMF) TaxID=293826 RepID=A6TL79_ALKMQ|nr:ATP-dependent RecD-like DNA helicase [Alkaliphilus metalliredigens]ABR46947.1 helicase, RecD/TraA family [Alkaliphilus metalliredigens QYMF]